MVKLYPATYFIFLLSICFSCAQMPDECNRFHTGRFLFRSTGSDTSYLIERNDTLQIETNEVTGRVTKLKVDWVNACQYKLTFLSKSTFTDSATLAFYQQHPLTTTIIKTGKDYYIFLTKAEELHYTLSDTLHLLDDNSK